MTKKIPPHQFQTSDPIRRTKYAIRSCDTCGLPETRTDVHTWPAAPTGAAEADAARLGETEHPHM